VRVFDLSSQLPVLRTFDRGQVTLKEGSDWNHTGPAESYSDADLEIILTFLNTVLQPSSN